MTNPGLNVDIHVLSSCYVLHMRFINLLRKAMKGVFLDVSKAFDKVWHEGILHKLRENGISDKLLNTV